MKTFDELWLELSQKALNQDPSSTTVKLLASGVHEIGKKIMEEAGEVWIAAEYQNKEQLAVEISQLIYHLQVLALARGIKLEEINKEL